MTMQKKKKKWQFYIKKKKQHMKSLADEEKVGAVSMCFTAFVEHYKQKIRNLW